MTVFSPQPVAVSGLAVNSWCRFRPQQLWALGDTSLLELPAVAVAGSRAMTLLGETVVQVTVDAAASLQGQVVVVTGGAPGVDACAVEACLVAQVPQVVWVADGVASAAERFESVLEAGGLLVSSHPPQTLPSSGAGGGPRARLARRSLDLPAASSLLVVAEAADGSGTMHAVRSAVSVGVPLVVPRPKPHVVSETAQGLRLLCRGRSKVELMRWGLSQAAAERFAGRSLASVEPRDPDELAQAVSVLVAFAPGC